LADLVLADLVLADLVLADLVLADVGLADLVWPPGAERPRQVAGHEKLKDHQKLVLERRAIIARRLVQTARAAVIWGPPILLPHEEAEWKKIRPTA
jgi:hypothetical protein